MIPVKLLRSRFAAGRFSTSFILVQSEEIVRFEFRFENVYLMSCALCCGNNTSGECTLGGKMGLLAAFLVAKLYVGYANVLFGILKREESG